MPGAWQSGGFCPFEAGHIRLMCCFTSIFVIGMASAIRFPCAAWEKRRHAQGGRRETAAFGAKKGSDRWRMRFSSACRGRWRSLTSSTSSPTTSPTSTRPALRPTTPRFPNILMPGARDDEFAGKDRRISFVEDRATLDRYESRRRPAYRQSARRRHRRQRLSHGANAARTALHAQRRSSRSTPRGSSLPAKAIR